MSLFPLPLPLPLPLSLSLSLPLSFSPLYLCVSRPNGASALGGRLGQEIGCGARIYTGSGGWHL